MKNPAKTATKTGTIFTALYIFIPDNIFYTLFLPLSLLKTLFSLSSQKKTDYVSHLKHIKDYGLFTRSRKHVCSKEGS